jgi:hypothetical protein
LGLQRDARGGAEGAEAVCGGGVDGEGEARDGAGGVCGDDVARAGNKRVFKQYEGVARLVEVNERRGGVCYVDGPRDDGPADRRVGLDDGVEDDAIGAQDTAHTVCKVA